MTATPSTLGIIPVLPSSDIDRDILWHKQFTGFEYYFGGDGYVGLRRESWEIHLQLHRGTPEDPMPSGSTVKIFVLDIAPYNEEFIRRGTIEHNKLRLHTPWSTHEFGFYDLSRNAFFFVQDA